MGDKKKRTGGNEGNNGKEVRERWKKKSINEERKKGGAEKRGIGEIERTERNMGSINVEKEVG